MVRELLSTPPPPQLQISSVETATPASPSDTQTLPEASSLSLQLPHQKIGEQSTPPAVKNVLRLQASTPASSSEPQQTTPKGSMSRPEMIQLVKRLRHLPSTKSADAINYKKPGSWPA